jgi:hypothetical protein
MRPGKPVLGWTQGSCSEIIVLGEGAAGAKALGRPRPLGLVWLSQEAFVRKGWWGGFRLQGRGSLSVVDGDKARAG